MSKFIVQPPIIHLPNIKLYKISGQELQQKLIKAWDWSRIDMEDSWYFYPKWEDWDKIFKNVQKDLPKYAPDVFDCDNFAMYVSVMVAKTFACNTCARVEGNTSFGRHKWNVFFDGDDFYQLESQRYMPPDSIAGLDDPDYIPEEIAIG